MKKKKKKEREREEMVAGENWEGSVRLLHFGSFRKYQAEEVVWGRVYACPSVVGLGQ